MYNTSANDIYQTIQSCFEAVYAQSQISSPSYSSYVDALGNVWSFADPCAAPAFLNPDVGGIGVYISFLMQSGIALLLFILLQVSTSWIYLLARAFWYKDETAVRAQNRFRHLIRHKATFTMLDFHKTQCYYIIAVEAAQLVTLFKQGGLALTSYGQYYNDLVMLYCISYAGLLPTTFTMALLQSTGQRSWYLLFLTTICVAALEKAFAVEHNASELPPSAKPAGFAQRGGNNPTSNCPQGEIPVDEVASFFVAFPIFMLVVLWLDQLSRAVKQTWLTSMNNPFQNGRKCAAATKYVNVCRVLLWSGFIAAYLYGFAKFFRLMNALRYFNTLDSTNWSFGQIISVTVYLPPLLDLVALIIFGVEDGIRYRIPVGLSLKRDESPGSSPDPVSTKRGKALDQIRSFLLV